MSSEAQMVDCTVHWPDGDDLAKVQLVIIHLCDEYCCHSLIESGAIHIDGGAHGQHKTDDAAVNVVVLQEALEGYRQCGRAGGDTIRSERSEHPEQQVVSIYGLLWWRKQLLTIFSHAADDWENTVITSLTHTRRSHLKILKFNGPCQRFSVLRSNFPKHNVLFYIFSLLLSHLPGSHWFPFMSTWN